jgi:2-dehydropantoate 2-reductase
MSDFEFAILGAGAMGSIVGAHLARAGHAVVMLARGARASYLEQHGLTIEGLSTFTTSVHTLREPQDLKRAGTLIVATKTPGTAAALAPLTHARLDLAVSIQNGPLKNDLLSAAFGRARVLGALADTSGELLADGTVLFTRNVGIYVGELDGGESVRAVHLAQTLEAAGVRAAASPEIQTLEWSKFCAWVGLMALAVTTRAPTWKYLSDPDSALLLARLVREMGKLAAALGIGLSDRAILPSASLCSAPDEQAAQQLLLGIGAEYRSKAPAHRMSALQDVEAGRPLEVHETLGYASERALTLGLALPQLETFRALVSAIDRTRREPDAAG